MPMLARSNLKMVGARLRNIYDVGSTVVPQRLDCLIPSGFFDERHCPQPRCLREIGQVARGYVQWFACHSCNLVWAFKTLSCKKLDINKSNIDSGRIRYTPFTDLQITMEATRPTHLPSLYKYTTFRTVSFCSPFIRHAHVYIPLVSSVREIFRSPGKGPSRTNSVPNSTRTGLLAPPRLTYHEHCWPRSPVSVCQALALYGWLRTAVSASAVEPKDNAITKSETVVRTTRCCWPIARR